MKHSLVLTTLTLIGTVLPIRGEAQPLAPGLVIGGSASGKVLMMPQSGGVIDLGIYAASGVQAVTMDPDNRDIVTAGDPGQNPSLLRLDINMGVRTTIWSGGPGDIGQAIDVDDRGDFMLLLRDRLLRIGRGSGIATTVHSDPSANYNAMIIDRTSGDFILGEYTAQTLIRVDRDTGTVTTIGTLSGVSAMAQDPHLSTIYISRQVAGTVATYDPLTGGLSTLTTTVGANSLTIDRAPRMDGAILFAGDPYGQVARLGRDGQVLGQMGAYDPREGLLSLAMFESRNVAVTTVTAPNDRRIAMHFPGDAGKPVQLALSATGYTAGPTLPDGRVIPLTVDGLTALTVAGPIPGILTGNAQVLDAQARATALLNLNAFGSAINGLRLWAVAISLDSSAPSGVSQVSAPVMLVL